MAKTVIFDVDNTLYDYDSAHREAYRALTQYACASFRLTPERFDALHRSANAELCARVGKNSAVIHNRLIRYQLMLEKLGQPIAHAPRMAELYWSTLLDHARAYPGTREGIARLRDAGFRIGVGTNMTADYQFAKLERLGLMEDVDFLVTSEEIGAEKPDARFFAFCAAKSGFDAAECVFVGDDAKKDVCGAIRAGMQAVWFCPAEPSAQTDVRAPRICALTELCALLSLPQSEGVEAP